MLTLYVIIITIIIIIIIILQHISTVQHVLPFYST